MSFIPQPIRVEVDGVVYLGEFTVSGRTVTVTRGMMRRSTFVGEEAPDTVARELLRALVELERYLARPRRG